ncbi:MAG: hypothetical protein U0L27_08045 [Ruminococcus sp.]|nr:hypothetical protein [Ruminococcus sp.]
MQSKKRDVIKYITFGALIICAIACVVSLIIMYSSGKINTSFTHSFRMYPEANKVFNTIAYLLLAAGFVLLALNYNLLPLTFLILSSFYLYFIELMAKGHDWTLFLMFIGFFVALLMYLYNIFSMTNTKSIFYLIIATLIFVYIFISNVILAVKSILTGASVSFNSCLYGLAMTLYCINFGISNQVFNGKFSIKDLITVEGYVGVLTDEERKEATRSLFGGWMLIASIVIIIIACFNSGTIAVVLGIVGFILFCIGFYLWGSNRNASTIAEKKKLMELQVKLMYEQAKVGKVDSKLVDDISGVTAAKQKAQKKEERNRIIKGAAVGGIIAGEEGAVVGAVIAKNNIDNEKKETK